MQEKIIQVLMEYLGLEREFISLDSKFNEHFGMDSIDFMEMLVKVESATNTKIDEAKISEIETVYDLIEYVEEVHLQFDYE